MNNELDEEALVDAVRRALMPPTAEPSPVEVARLRMAVAELRAAREAPTRPAGQIRSLVPGRLRRPLPVLVALLIGVGGVTAGAAGAGASLPSPLRRAAVAVGLPIDDAALAAARTDVGRVRGALERGNRGSVASAVVQLRRCLDRLSPGDRAHVEPGADQLLAAADRFLSTAPPPTAGGPAQPAPTAPVGSSSPASRPRPTTTTTARGGPEGGSPEGGSVEGGSPEEAPSPTTAPAEGSPVPSPTVAGSGDGRESGQTTTSVAPTTTVVSSSDGGGTETGTSGAGSDGGTSPTDGGGGSTGG